MRVSSIVLATACLLASPAAADPAQVLASKGSFAGGSVNGVAVCNVSCVKFEVREGERYLHLVLSGTPGDVVADVTTATGVVRVCQSTKVIGSLPIEGLKAVTVTPVLDSAVGCGRGTSATGTVLALFSNRDLSLAEAQAIMQPDPTRQVSGL